MKKTVILIFISGVLGVFYYLFSNLENKKDINNQQISGQFDKSLQRTDEEWKKILTNEQYQILREKGTEIPFTGKLLNEKREGIYYSYGCNKPVFHSAQKYDSGTGWPSFIAPFAEKSVVLRLESNPNDNSIEVLDLCGGHLGHVFDDGPLPTGKRYCINSEALYFVPSLEK